jgi:signal recognition particle receptor subunit beta
MRRDSPIAKQYYTIIVIGAWSSGKSEFIRTISDFVGCIDFPDRLSVECGQISLDDETAILLITPPGNRRFDFIWSAGLLIDNLLGFIAIVDSAYPTSFREAGGIIQTFEVYAPRPYIVACNPHYSIFNPKPPPVNGVEQDLAWDVESVQNYMRLFDTSFIACDAKNREQVKAGLIHFLETVERETIDEEFEPLAPELAAFEPHELFTLDKERKWIVTIGTTFSSVAEFAENIANQKVWLVEDAQHLPYKHYYFAVDDQLELHLHLTRNYGAFYSRTTVAVLLNAIAQGQIPPKFEEDALEISELAQRDGILGCVVCFHSRTQEDLEKMQHLAQTLKSLPTIFVDTVHDESKAPNFRVMELHILRRELSLPDNMMLVRETAKDKASAQRVLDALLFQIRQSASEDDPNVELAARIKSAFNYE